MMDKNEVQAWQYELDVAPASGLVQNVHGVGYHLLPANPEED